MSKQLEAFELLQKLKRAMQSFVLFQSDVIPVRLIEGDLILMIALSKIVILFGCHNYLTLRHQIYYQIRVLEIYSQGSYLLRTFR